MSEQIPKRVRQRVAAKQNEGVAVRSVSRNKEEGAETIERFVADDCNDPAYITVGATVTKNLGNYESLKINVSITLPCYPTPKAVEENRAKASAMVEEFVNLELEGVGE